MVLPKILTMHIIMMIMIISMTLLLHSNSHIKYNCGGGDAAGCCSGAGDAGGCGGCGYLA